MPPRNVIPTPKKEKKKVSDKRHNAQHSIGIDRQIICKNYYQNSCSNRTKHPAPEYFFYKGRMSTKGQHLDLMYFFNITYYFHIVSHNF